jgi:hypothetical protein
MVVEKGCCNTKAEIQGTFMRPSQIKSIARKINLNSGWVVVVS